MTLKNRPELCRSAPWRKAQACDPVRVAGVIRKRSAARTWSSHVVTAAGLVNGSDSAMSGRPGIMPEEFGLSTMA